MADHRVQAGFLATALFAVYAAGACRTIYVGDSGELAAAVHVLGIPHPTGYPLYVLLGKLWTLLVPLGSIAFRLSLFSAACAATACAGLYLLLRRLATPGAAALFAALLLAFSPSFWGEANIQRVYALSALFLVAALSAAATWQRTGSPRALLLALFLAALGATNHTYLGIFLAALLVWALASRPELLRQPRLLGNLATGAAAVVLGLLPYAYLPLRSRMDPPLDWGDPETLDRFLAVVTRRDFWDRAWWESPRDFLPIAGDWLASLGEESLWAGLPLALLGALLARRRAPVGLALLGMVGNLALLAFHGSRHDLFLWHRYYIPSYLLLAFLAGLGATEVARRLPRRLGAVLLVIPLALAFLGWRANDRSRYRLADDFSRKLLAGIPPGAHLSASDDNILFVLIYLQMVEGVRPDVDLILQGVGEADLPPLRFDPDQDPVYFTHHPNWDLPALEVVPMGLAYKIQRAGSTWADPPLPGLSGPDTQGGFSAPPAPPPNLAALPDLTLAGERDPRVPQDALTQNLIGHFHFMLGVTFERRYWPRAAAELQRAAEAAPHDDVLAYNLGLIWRRNGLYDRTRDEFARAQALNPRALATRSRVRPSDALAETERELARLGAIEARLAASPELAPLPRESAAYHEALAAALERVGEPLAAHGHRLRAQEREPQTR